MQKSILNLSIATLIGGLTLSGGVLAHSSDKANEGYVGDSSGHLVTDGSGNCVTTTSWSKDKALEACHPDLVKKPEPAPVAAPAPAPAPEPTYETVSLSAGALFDVNKDSLKPAGQQQLRDFAARVKALGNIERITIAGHTDSSGSDAYNQKLSERRAASVKNFLVGEGLDSGMMDTVGYGESRPVADNRTADGRSQNRRVEITLQGSRQVK